MYYNSLSEFESRVKVAEDFVLKETQIAKSQYQLVVAGQKKNITSTYIKAAFWRLLDRGLIKLTKDGVVNVNK